MLNETGFTSLISIASLKVDNFIDIENYIKTKESVSRQLTEYGDLNAAVFELKPGHKAAIKELQRRVSKYLEEKKQKTLPRPIPEKSDDTLKLELVKKLQSFLTKISSKITISNEDLYEFYREENSLCHCRVQCSICLKLVRCTYTSHWAVSNLESHWRNHTAAETGAETNSVVQSVSQALTSTQSNSANIHRVDSSNIHELRSVLTNLPIVFIDNITSNNNLEK